MGRKVYCDMLRKGLYRRSKTVHLQKSCHLSSGRVYSQGTGLFGALGRGDGLKDSKSFDLIAAPVDSSSFSPRRVIAGWGHSVVLTEQGSMLVFGRPYDFSVIMQLNRLKTVAPSFAQLVGKFTHYLGGGPDGLSTIPTPVNGLRDVVSVSCGAGLTVSMTESGDVFTFGQNRWGQCGIGDNKRYDLCVALLVLFSQSDCTVKSSVASKLVCSSLFHTNSFKCSTGYTCTALRRLFYQHQLAPLMQDFSTASHCRERTDKCLLGVKATVVSWAMAIRIV
jgi:alpha-tubulin suppressor-like RCC1 family protein